MSPRCCQGATCSCLIQGSSGVTVTGSGTSQDPYVIAGNAVLDVLDTTVFNLTLGGTGTPDDPYVLRVDYASTATLGDISDVNAPAPTNGQVLGFDTTTNKWTPRAPTTAAAGSVLTDTSLTGDGSSGSHLAALHNPSGYTQTTSTGIGLTDNGKRNMVLHYASATVRAADSLTPAINTISMLDDTPGVQDYWTGSEWVPVTNGVSRSLGGEFMQLSGDWDGVSPITLVTRRVGAITDSTGYFDILSDSDLTTLQAAGVLVCHFQETGAVGFKAVVVSNINAVGAIAYRLDNGLPYASQAIEGTALAYVY